LSAEPATLNPLKIMDGTLSPNVSGIKQGSLAG
jgi:hypothetical protein